MKKRLESRGIREKEKINLMIKSHEDMVPFTDIWHALKKNLLETFALLSTKNSLSFKFNNLNRRLIVIYIIFSPYRIFYQTVVKN